MTSLCLSDLSNDVMQSLWNIITNTKRQWLKKTLKHAEENGMPKSVAGGGVITRTSGGSVETVEEMQ